MAARRTYEQRNYFYVLPEDLCSYKSCEIKSFILMISVGLLLMFRKYDILQNCAYSKGQNLMSLLSEINVGLYNCP